jgi:predicted protein tyrosine phosphatase
MSGETFDQFVKRHRGIVQSSGEIIPSNIRQLFAEFIFPPRSAGTVWWDMRDDNFCYSEQTDTVSLIDVDSLAAYADEILMDDIAEEMDGMIAPSEEHIEDLIRFLERWDRSTPLIVHCYAGISRSTAAAFISACVVSPCFPENEIARRLRLASPTARPNTRLVSIPDARLGRNGRMIRAVSAIGEGLGAYESTPFVIRL